MALDLAVILARGGQKVFLNWIEQNKTTFIYGSKSY
jgi:hypothetical protein